ncbi:MAG TPA: DUF5678 domain-containing protein [Thermoanaerobaculia bacterium]|nr:DUF5678 domain-containing protein [Thermoanaerobaculia bacterium]
MSAEAVRRYDFKPYNPDSHVETPEEFLGRIHESLNAATLSGAREWAERGVERFPDHEELRRLHRLLQPGRSQSVPGPRIPDRQDSFDWIRENASKYEGQWIAILGTRLVAASKDLSEVLRAVRESGLEEEMILLHHVA